MSRFVYKFRPLANEVDWDRFQKTITESTLYMGPAADLNDQIEGRVNVTGEASVVKQVYRAIEALREDACVLSLSEAITEPLMWAHYAQGFRGIALEFDRSRCDWMSELYPVEYRDSIPEVDVDDVDSLADGRLIDPVLLTKSTAWSYEKELRYAQARSDREGPCDFILAKYPRDSLRAIVVGCRVPLYEREKLIELTKRHKRHVEFRFAAPAGPSSHEVDIKRTFPAPTPQEKLRRDIKVAQALGFGSVMIEYR